MTAGVTGGVLEIHRYTRVRDMKLEGVRVVVAPDAGEYVSIQGCILTRCDLSGMEWRHLSYCVLRDCTPPGEGSPADAVGSHVFVKEKPS